MSGYFLILSNLVGLLPSGLAFRRSEHYLGSLYLLTTLVSAWYHAVFLGWVESRYPLTRGSLLMLDHTLSHAAISGSLLMLANLPLQINTIINLFVLLLLTSLTYDGELSTVGSALFFVCVAVVSALGIIRKRLRVACLGMAFDNLGLSVVCMVSAFMIRAVGDTAGSEGYNLFHGGWHILIFASAFFLLGSPAPIPFSLWRMMADRWPRLRCGALSSC